MSALAESRGAPRGGSLRVAWHDCRVGPTAIFDKSALEALSLDEAVWFDAFFYANVVPIFYVETLADLEKEMADGRTPEDVVGRLAEKTPDNAAPNVHHRQVIMSELAGLKVDMVTGRALINAGELKQAPDGSIGVHIDEFPEHAALLRWKDHDFLDLERAIAKGWRAELAEHDPDRVLALVQDILPADTKISNLERLKAFIDSFCLRRDPEAIALALDVLEVPPDYRRAAADRWAFGGRPPLVRLAPYTAHVFKVDLLYYLGIQRSFIPRGRASSKADMAYLYYLPFAMAFVSRDKLHRRTVPLFLRRNQSYLDGDDLKSALRELDQHYDDLPDEIKQLGVLAFAHYPPAELDNAVTRLWDEHMRPDWREIARRNEALVAEPRDEEADRGTVAELNRRLDAAEPVADKAAGLHANEADYMVISRKIAPTKGKWRIVPEEVEQAGREN
jgi:hypothetical protein